MQIGLMTLLLVVAMIVGTSQPAHAYLDPGTGSYSAQVILAGLMVGAFTLRSFFRRAMEAVLRLFRSR